MTDRFEYRGTNMRGAQVGFVGTAPFDIDESATGKKLIPVEIAWDGKKEVSYEKPEAEIAEVWHDAKKGENVTVTFK